MKYEMQRSTIPKRLRLKYKGSRALTEIMNGPLFMFVETWKKTIRTQGKR